MFSKMVMLIVFVISSIIFAAAYPVQPDLEVAATGDHHHGRVQIKVYRGPTEHSGHDYFAPWGYWVKQPGDDHH